MQIKKRAILVVEDEEAIREVLRRTLQGEGYHVICAEDGKEALALIQENRPEMILLDLMLPEMDGAEVCRRVREDPVLGTIPIMMITGKDTFGDLEQGLALGADDYVVKPFDVREIKLRVAALFRRHERELGA
ncbi:MAG: response regulator [Elusimicrobia bacterium]|nr:response regulator [Elusimicrobiota bacterium]